MSAAETYERNEFTGMQFSYDYSCMYEYYYYQIRVENDLQLSAGINSTVN